MSLRRAIRIVCIVLVVHRYQQCNAFARQQTTLTVATAHHHSLNNVRSACSLLYLPSDKTNDFATELATDAGSDEEDLSRPNVVRLITHEEYVDFIQDDGRVCVVKFYADWCKSCQKFGIKYRHLAHDMGDRVNIDGEIVHWGNVRFAEVEYTASARLCKSLKVNKLPTVHMYQRGKGKIVDMTCKPSLFHLVVDELYRLQNKSEVNSKSEMDIMHEKEVTRDGDRTSASFDLTMIAGLSLGKELTASMKEKNMDVSKTMIANWFRN